MKNAESNIPPQTQGRQTDFSDSISFENTTDAGNRFRMACARMLDVNNWHQYSGGSSATFMLTDEKGIQLRRLAQQDDYICIDLPATPGPDAGGGLEWVQVDSLAETGHADDPEEAVILTLRPVPDPRNDDPAVAHFYSDVSTNTLIVRREVLQVSAEAHGRNESPNNTNVSLHDAVRNTAIALTARIGLSGMQWQKLVEGVLAE